MRLRFSPLVPGDLEVILHYIAQDSPRHALRTVRILRARCYEIAARPQMYRLRPEIDSDARLAPVGNYVILFRIHHDVVRIERIVNGQRDLSGLLKGER